MQPPVPNRGHSELCGIMIHAYADPTFIATRVIHSIGKPLAQLLVFEIMHAHGFWCALRLPLSSPVLEISDQLFLFCIYGNHRLSTFLKLAAAPAEILKLLVAIGMPCSFLTFL